MSRPGHTDAITCTSRPDPSRSPRDAALPPGRSCPGGRPPRHTDTRPMRITAGRRTPAPWLQRYRREFGSGQGGAVVAMYLAEAGALHPVLAALFDFLLSWERPMKFHHMTSSSSNGSPPRSMRDASDSARRGSSVRPQPRRAWSPGASVRRRRAPRRTWTGRRTRSRAPAAVVPRRRSRGTGRRRRSGCTSCRARSCRRRCPG